MDYGLLAAIITGSVLAGAGLSKILVTKTNGNGNGYQPKGNYITKDVCDSRYNSLTGWMERIDKKLDKLMERRN